MCPEPTERHASGPLVLRQEKCCDQVAGENEEDIDAEVAA